MAMAAVLPSIAAPRRPQATSCLKAASLLVFVFAAARPAYGYIGPGAGFALLVPFFSFFVVFLLTLAALLSWPFRLLLGAARKPAARPDRKVRRAIVIGFDGMEPGLAERFMGQGLLPNLSGLREQGTFCPLGTTLPALSPVAWSTFQTGVNPGKHAIFDFIRRDARTYLGKLSSARIRPPRRRLRLKGIHVPLGKPVLQGLRRSKPFWAILGEKGVSSIILRVPITFPPEPFQGMSLSGMCVPDLQGTQGSFSYYTDRPDSMIGTDAAKTIRVRWNGLSLDTCIPGPPHPFRPSAGRLQCPLRLERRESSLTIRVNGTRRSLAVGEYTPWMAVPFRAGPFRIRGTVRFYLKQLRPYFDLYLTPVNIDPAFPSLPISHPRGFSVYLAKKKGPFATLGLAEDTSGLNEGVLDDQAFLRQCYDIHREREEVFWDALDHVRDGLLVSVFDLTDRVQHMFWRDEDRLHPARPPDRDATSPNALEEVYRKADAFLGKLLDRIGPDTLLLVISDHGFASFRRAVNLNTWLQREGYLAFQGSGEPGEWFKGVDWSRTRAFALGLCGVYLNLRGRERSGTVQPGAEARRLRREIACRLKDLQDPRNGARPIHGVFEAVSSYRGPYRDEAPDLLVTFREGYRVSWESATGQVSDAVFADNTRCWSGDHCLRPDLIPGVFFSNRKLLSPRPRLLDLAPTLLAAFGIEPPAYMDGRAMELDWDRGAGESRDGPHTKIRAAAPQREERMARKIKIDGDLMRRLMQCSRAAGYTSAEEFVAHVLEKEIARQEAGDEEEVSRKLKGLGYIS
ncbi:MAG: alkaline phosphatase family protein [bacterium]